MGFCIVQGKNLDTYKSYKQYGSLYVKILNKKTPAPLISEINTKNIYIGIGEVYDNEMLDLLKQDWEINHEYLLTNGDFSLLKVDFDKNTINIASSQTGIENLFYYQSDGLLIITDDFWEAVNIIEPDFQDIDQQILKESVVCVSAISCDTIIKGLKWLPPANIANFNWMTKGFAIIPYWNFRYTIDEKLTLSEATERLDRIFDETMEQIKEKCGDVQYAVGLSGGLDSRVIPYYATKHNMKLTPFIIGTKRPSSFLISRDHKSAREIARYYKLNLKDVHSVPDGFDVQLQDDMKTYPLGPSGLLRLAMNKIPQCDVLLTGASGFVVGSMIPHNIADMDSTELAEYILDLSGRVSEISTFKNNISRALKYLFHINYKPKSNCAGLLEQIMSSDSMEVMSNRVYDFILERLAKGYSNIEVFEDYFNNILGFRNRNGAFESIGGTKRSFSIYLPYVFIETLNWDLYLLKDRAVLKKLVCDKIPALADIKMQSFYSSINKKEQKFRKVWDMFGFLLRGRAEAHLSGFKMRLNYKKTYNMVMNNDTKWFYSIIPSEINLFAKKVKNTAFSNNLIKRKGVIDMIERKEYKRFAEEKQIKKC